MINKSLFISLIIGSLNSFKEMFLHRSLANASFKAYLHSDFHDHVAQINSVHHTECGHSFFDELKILKDLYRVFVAVKGVQVDD